MRCILCALPRNFLPHAKRTPLTFSLSLSLSLFLFHPAAELAKRFKTDGMLAYVDLIQKKEKAIGCDVFTHQKWSGASYSDRVLNGTSPSNEPVFCSGCLFTRAD